MYGFYEGPFWVAVVEFTEENCFKAVRFLFGSEPRDEEILDFIYNRLEKLLENAQQGLPMKMQKKQKVNPKRLARQVSSEMKVKGASSYAQQAIQLAYEDRKLEKKKVHRRKKELDRIMKRNLRKQKAKEKHRGH